MFEYIPLLQLIATCVPLLLIVSRRFRLFLVRTVLRDYAALSTYSEMGRASGDARYNDKIQGIIKENIPGFIGSMASDNPLVGKAIEYFMNETELSEYLDDPRTLGAIMEFLQSAEGGIDLSTLLSGSGLSNSQKQDIQEGFRIG